MNPQPQPAPPPPLPPRTCFMHQHQVLNPVCQYTTYGALCGGAARKDVDVLTTDKDLVTCKQCRLQLGLDVPPPALYLPPPEVEAELHSSLPTDRPNLPRRIWSFFFPKKKLDKPS